MQLEMPQGADAAVFDIVCHLLTPTKDALSFKYWRIPM